MGKLKEERGLQVLAMDNRSEYRRASAGYSLQLHAMALVQMRIAMITHSEWPLSRPCNGVAASFWGTCSTGLQLCDLVGGSSGDVATKQKWPV